MHIDVSANVVGSGSSDNKACVWDRRLGGVVATLPHDKGVNGIAFKPGDGAKELSV
jgi:WD40 repeat protein